MKKLIVMMILFSVGIFASAQQTVLAMNVPKIVKDKFNEIFPKASMVTWEKEGNNYEADFKDEGTSMEAVFTPEGGYLQKEIHIDETALPASSRQYMEKNYPGKKIKECLKIVKADGKVFYEAEADENEVTFDADGKYVSMKKE